MTSANKLLLAFFLSYSFVWGLIGVYPVQAVDSKYVFLSFINSLFLVLVFVFAFVVSKIPFRRSFVGLDAKQEKNIRANVYACCVLSFIGIAFIIYDRVVLRDINYFEGLRAARYQWLNSEGGSVFSISGNLLVPLSYAGLCFLIANRSLFGKLGYYFYFVVFFGVNVGHAALNGGRSNVLLAIIMVVIGFCLREGPVKPRTLVKLFFSGLLLIFLVYYYVSVVVESSAALGGIDLSDLLKRSLMRLNADTSTISFASLSDLEALILYITSYLIHGQWTAQSLADISSFEGQHLIVPIAAFLDGQGVVSLEYQKSYFSEKGNFLSMPAALYHDFGYLGLVIFSSFIGSLWGIGLLFLRDRANMTGVKLGFLVFFCYFVFLAPITPAHGFAYFKFVIYSFVAVGLMNRLFYGRRYRLI